MSNDIEIRITSRNQSGAGFNDARFGLQRVEIAAQATRRATAALAEADRKLASAQAEVAAAAEAAARGELADAEATQRAAAAARELERATLAQAEAHAVAAAAADHQAAQERQLARDSSRAAHEADNSGGMFRRMLTSMESAAGSASQGLGKLGASVSEMSPVMLYGIIAALVALPALAILAGGAITLGLGGALAAVAIKAASSNAQVQKSFNDLKTHVSSSLKTMAQPFVPVLEHIARTATQTFDKLAPTLSAAFKEMAPSVQYFVDQLGVGLAAMGPTISKVAAEFSPLMNALGDRMPEIMGNFADAIDGVVSAVSGHEQDFAMFVEFLSGIVANTGQAIGVLGKLADTVAPIKYIAQAFADVGSSVGGSAKGWGEADAASWDAQKSIVAASDAMNLASTSAEQLTAKLDELSGGQLTERAAARDFQAAIDDMTAGLKKNGHTLDINTSAGRKNQENLDRIASTGLKMAESQQKIDKTGVSAAKTINATRAAYIKAAEGAGLNHDAAVRLADSMGLVATRAGKIPSKTETKVLGTIHDLESKVEAAKRQLKTVPASKRASVLATIKDLESKVAAAKRQLSGIRGKTVTIRMNQLWSSTGAYIGGRGGGPGRATGGVVGGLATGGNMRGFDSGGSSGSAMALVGEAGRELVRLPYGSTVIPHGQTEAMLADDDDGWDDDEGYASGGVVSRRRHKKKKKKRKPYNWNVSQTIKKSLASGQTKTIQPDAYTPSWWHGQTDENVGVGGAHFSWGGDRPDEVTPASYQRKLTTAEIEKNAHDAIEKRVAAVVAAALKQHKQVIEIHSNGTEHADYLVSLLRKAIRVKGGNVQVVLGK